MIRFSIKLIHDVILLFFSFSSFLSLSLSSQKQEVVLLKTAYDSSIKVSQD